jgi:hypothetical protein
MAQIEQQNETFNPDNIAGRIYENLKKLHTIYHNKDLPNGLLLSVTTGYIGALVGGMSAGLFFDIGAKSMYASSLYHSVAAGLWTLGGLGVFAAGMAGAVYCLQKAKQEIQGIKTEIKNEFENVGHSQQRVLVKALKDLIEASAMSDSQEAIKDGYFASLGRGKMTGDDKKKKYKEQINTIYSEIIEEKPYDFINKKGGYVKRQVNNNEFNMFKDEKVQIGNIDNEELGDSQAKIDQPNIDGDKSEKTTKYIDAIKEKENQKQK